MEGSSQRHINFIANLILIYLPPCSATAISPPKWPV
jgi:hypothetical protein